MSNEKFQNQYRIKSARATWHDYSGGAYFITVCTKNREHSFGEIVVVETGHAPSQSNVAETSAIEMCTNKTGHAPSLHVATMRLTSIGQFLTEKIQNTTNHCPYAEIPLFVVMPNHWHAIVFIDGDKTPYVRGNSVVETGHAPSLPEHNTQTGHAPSLHPQTTTNEKMQKNDACKGWLSVAIGGIKSSVTKFASENAVPFAWQTRFHDHIIRDQSEMNRIADYIENNPSTWDTDCFNKNNNPK